MKALKLILIALVVLGVIVGLLFLSGGETTTEIKGDKSKQMTMLQNKIAGEWAATSEWDTELLTKDLDLLKQYSQNLGDGYRTLVDLTGEKACQRLDSVVSREFASTECNPNNIETYANGLDILLAKIPNYKNDVKVQRMQGTITLYRNIRKLNKRSLNLNPKFNFEDDTWANFNAHSQKILNERNSYRQSDYYQYICHIDEIKNGLSNVERRLNEAKTTFRNKLADQIMQAYSPQNPELKDRLGQVHSRFLRELGGQPQLNIFVQNY